MTTDEEEEPHEMLPAAEIFKPYVDALHATARSLNDHKDRLLDCLREHDGRIDNRDAAWWAIVAIAQHYSRNRHNAEPLPDKLIQDARKVSTALARARDALRAMHASAPDYISIVPFGTLAIFDAANEAQLTEMIAQADRFVSKPHGAIGSPLVADCIHELATVFLKWTKRNPGAGEGPFAEFVFAFSDATGRGRAQSTIVDDIKAARKINPAAFKPELDTHEG